VLVPLTFAGVLALADRVVLALVVLVTTVVLTLVTVLRPTWGERIAAGFAAVGRLVANVVSWVLLAVVEVFVLTPVSVVSRLLRRDPLATGEPGSRWETRPGRLSSRRTFGPDQGTTADRGPVLRALAVVPRAIGWVVLVALLNYGVGWTWDELFGTHDMPDVAAITEVVDLADAPVFADDPWASDYWAEYDRLDHEPVPFLLTRLADVAGDDITSTDGVRRSYEPAGGDHPVVWFFGGGALWGEGQRDLGTIPSEVARLAEAAGSPVEVVNLGQPGYTTWQAALLFEQELAVRPAPDLAVFYGGADDAAVQVERPSTAPSHYNVAGLQGVIGQRESAAEQARELWEDYRETSVLTRLAQRLGGIFAAQPAFAADDGMVDRLEDLRRRSDALVADVAADHDVPVLQVWQAASDVPGDGGAYREATTDDGALDLRAVLDDVGDDAYADGVVTDEAGARLVAEALWSAIADDLG
jgi:hypothetical protein